MRALGGKYLTLIDLVWHLRPQREPQRFRDPNVAKKVSCVTNLTKAKSNELRTKYKNILQTHIYFRSEYIVNQNIFQKRIYCRPSVWEGTRMLRTRLLPICILSLGTFSSFELFRSLTLLFQEFWSRLRRWRRSRGTTS